MRIARIGPDGTPLGSPTTHTAPSESEAIQVMRRAIELARKLTEPMQFTVHGPGNRLLMSYTTEGVRSDAVKADTGLTP